MQHELTGAGPAGELHPQRHASRRHWARGFAAAGAAGCMLAALLATGRAHAQAPAPAQEPAPAAVAAPAVTPPAAAPAPVPAPAGAGARVQVADPYLEVRTGPGRGYPIFHVAARHEWVEITLRHTDWYKVRTANGREGWVDRAQMERTLAGERSFRDLFVDDYLRSRLELGAAYGRFKTEPMLKVWTGYRINDAFSIEATIGQVQGVFSGTDFWHLNLNIEPWNDQRLSPFFALGVGKFRNFPNTSLVGAINTNAKLGDASLGLRYRLTERFVARIDYSLYTAFVSDTRTGEYRALTAGLSFSF